MTDNLIKNIRFLLLSSGVVCLTVLSIPGPGLAWTSAHIFNVDVTVDVARTEHSEVLTEVRFIVEGGRFHGFELVDLPGATLDEAACSAVRDDGEELSVVLEQLRDGRQRMLLADDRAIKRGGITFKLVHKIDLMATSALRPYEGRARLDWTPLIWDEGLDKMTVTVKLPGISEDGPIIVDQAVSRDYVVETERDAVTFTEYRPVRWYPMQLVIYFDPKLVPELSLATHEEQQPAPIVAEVSKERRPPIDHHLAVIPVVVALIGLLALILKTRHVRSAYQQTGNKEQFALLSNTSLFLRCVLALSALALGLAAQQVGYLAAGIPAMTAVAACFVMLRESDEIKLRPGGAWRQMTEKDLEKYGRLVWTYRRSRISLIDITTVRGILCFGLYVCGLGYIAYTTYQQAPRMAWTAVIDGLILGVPAWFGSIRSELPVDATLEGFYTLKRWRKSLSKLLGGKTADTTAEFWVREDEDGPIDVRLRAALPIEGLNNIEVAGEVVRAGSLFRTRTVFVFRLEPGAQVTRQLAKSPHAAEHHLTPNLQEEIIVLRNRRGRTASGLAPIRSALALINSQAINSCSSPLTPSCGE